MKTLLAALALLLFLLVPTTSTLAGASEPDTYSGNPIIDNSSTRAHLQMISFERSGAATAEDLANTWLKKNNITDARFIITHAPGSRVVTVIYLFRPELK